MKRFLLFCWSDDRGNGGHDFQDSFDTLDLAAKAGWNLLKTTLWADSFNILDSETKEVTEGYETTVS